jgi:hypothetical protein
MAITKKAIEVKIIIFEKRFNMKLALTDKTINKYFKFLTSLDINSKKRLIIKLTESIETEQLKEFDLRNFYGAWNDSRDSDAIIKEIKDSRVNKTEEIKL